MNALKESLVTIRNLTDIADSLIDMGYKPEKGSRLATVLELMFVEIQAVNDDYCVVKDEKGTTI